MRNMLHVKNAVIMASDSFPGSEEIFGTESRANSDGPSEKIRPISRDKSRQISPLLAKPPGSCILNEWDYSSTAVRCAGNEQLHDL